MTKGVRPALFLLCGLALADPSAAQNNSSGTEPFEPFRLAGNLYYVGTRGVSSFLFVTPAQHASMFRMEDKVRRMKAGEVNAFIDPQGYEALVAVGEQAYLAQLKREQGK